MSDKAKRILGVALRLLLVLAVFALLGVALYYAYKAIGWDKLKDREALQQYIASFGAIGPLVFIALCFLQVSFIPLPSAAVIIAGAYAFGGGLAFLYGYTGVIAGSILAFYLGRWLGRPFVNFIAGDKAVVDKWLDKIKKKENVVIFFIFLFPFFPDDLVCSIAGLTKMRFINFLWMQLLTRAIQIGSNVLLMSGELIPYSGWGIPVLVVLGIAAIAAFVVCYIYAEKIEAFFLRIINKIANRITKKGSAAVIAPPGDDAGVVMGSDVADADAKHADGNGEQHAGPDSIDPKAHEPRQEDGGEDAGAKQDDLKRE